jgi:hypothetical protein
LRGKRSLLIGFFCSLTGVPNLVIVKVLREHIDRLRKVGNTAQSRMADHTSHRGGRRRTRTEGGPISHNLSSCDHRNPRCHGDMATSSQNQSLCDADRAIPIQR